MVNGCPNTIAFCRIGLAIYFLAIAYLGLTIWAFIRYRRISQYIVNRWNSTKLFHLFIVLDLVFRTLSLGIIAVFIIFEVKVWSSLLVILYTLPEFLILSVYILLFFHWLEVFVFSREQFVVTDKQEFRKKWHFWWAIITLIFYILLSIYYAMIIIKNEQKFDENALSAVESAGGIACLVLPACGCLLWSYWSCCSLSGFPFRSQVEEEKVRKTNFVVIIWTLSRITRGITFLSASKQGWEKTLNPTYLSMVVIAILVVTEWLPFFYALDWSVVGILLIGDEGRGLLRGNSYTKLGDEKSISIYMRPQENEYTDLWIEISDLEFISGLLNDDGFTFKQMAKYKNNIVSIKGFRFNITSKTEGTLIDELISEVLRFGHIKHQNIIELLGAGRNDQSVFIVSEHIAAHTLQNVLERSTKPFFPETIIKIALTLASTLKYIHNYGSQYYHGNLRSTNILLDSSLSVKVSEIGLARIRNYAEILLVQRLASRWSAPEVLMGRTANKAADIYSFGIIMWELWTRRTPFENMSMDDIRKAVVKDKIQLDIPNNDIVDIEYRNLMIECWNFQPNDRPSFDEIVRRLEEII